MRTLTKIVIGTAFITAQPVTTFAADPADIENSVVRYPPIMPEAATHSGHCKLTFDLDDGGKPINVKSRSCSDSLFKQASINSVKKWKYEALQGDKSHASRRNIETKVTFRLSDIDGTILPEPEPVTKRVKSKNNNFTGAKIVDYFGFYKPIPMPKNNRQFCCAEFSISQIGNPFNVNITQCSDDQHADSTDYIVRQMLAIPATVDNQPVSSDNHSILIHYYYNKYAENIPNPEGFPESLGLAFSPIPGSEEDYQKRCIAIS